MASSNFVRDGRLMSASELPELGSVILDADYPATSSDSKPLELKAPTHRDNEHYNMSHKRRGKLIIFNHENYDDPNVTKREGTNMDRDNLEKVFAEMKFKVDVCDDFTAAAVIDKLQEEASDDSFYRESDCLVVALMTHGYEGGLIHAKDIMYQVESIWAPFLGDKCPALVGKPKIFIVQACRGGRASEPLQLDHESKVQRDGQKVQPYTMKYSIPSESDVLIVYSSFIGKLSYRCEEKGTWFIQELCTELYETGKTDDFLSVLTKVNRRVAHERVALGRKAHECNHGVAKQMPMIQSTLTRKIFLAGTSHSVSDGFHPSYGGKIDEILTTVRELNLVGPRRTPNRPRPSGEWDAIKPKNQSFEIAQTEDQILRIAHAMEKLLSDKNQALKPSDREHGVTILNLVAVWGSLSHDQRCFAYGRLDTFLRTHGKDWEYMRLVTLPPTCVEKRRRSSAASTTHAPTNGCRSHDRQSMKKRSQ